MNTYFERNKLLVNASFPSSAQCDLFNDSASMRRVRGRSKVDGYFRSLTVPGLCFCHELIGPLMLNCHERLSPPFGKISTKFPSNKSLIKKLYY